MNTDGINRKWESQKGHHLYRPELIVGISDPRGFEKVPTLKTTFKEKTVGLNFLGDRILFYFEFGFEFLLHEGPGEVVGVALEVVVVHHRPQLVAHGLYPRLPARGVVEHFNFVRELITLEIRKEDRQKPICLHSFSA